MAKYPEWTEISWPYNSAIKLPCYAKTINGYQVFLHPAYKCLDTEANDGNGEWTIGEGFEFSVKGQYSGRCPDSVTTIEEAKAHLEKVGTIK